MSMYLGHGPDDLHGDLLSRANVDCSHHLAKCALTEKREEIVAFTETTVLMHNVVSVLVVNLLRGLLSLQKGSVCGYFQSCWILTSWICGTVTSFIFLICFGGTY